MKRGFLDAGGRNNNHRKKTTTNTDTCLASGDETLNDATTRVDAVMKVVSPLVVEETIAIDSPMVNTLGVGSNPPPPTQEANAPAGNALGKPSYATDTNKSSGKKVNVRTLYTPEGDRIDVVVLVHSICSISERFANTAYGFFLGKKVEYPVVANYVRNTWGKYGLVRSIFSSSTGLFSFQFSSIDGLDAMLENGPREGHNTCNLYVEYEWKPPRCSYCKVFRHIHEECKKNTGVGDKKTVKKPSQTSRGVLVGLKIGFKLQKEYRPVTKKPNASSSGNKKKGVEPTIEVSNSNPFDVLNSVYNDVEFSTNRETTNLVNNKATLSGSSFMNIDNDREFVSNTPIGEKVYKIERQICEGKLRLLDNDRNPLVPTGIVESKSEVEVVFDETANLRIPTSDNDDYDPYDDDMYDNHDLSEHLQSICNDLDIMVCGRKKK
nr:hypothetical protein [Tanacetum cinerariifolium]